MYSAAGYSDTASKSCSTVLHTITWSSGQASEVAGANLQGFYLPAPLWL